jgi:hypothetical protein
VTGQRYESKYLGLAFTAPAGLEKKPNPPSAVVALLREQPFASGILFLAPAGVFTPARALDMATATANAWRRGAHPVAARSGARTLGIGKIEWQDWSVEGTDKHFAIGAVPFCDRGTLLINAQWGRADGEALVESWLRSLASLGQPQPGACKDAAR